MRQVLGILSFGILASLLVASEANARNHHQRHHQYKDSVKSKAVVEAPKEEKKDPTFLSQFMAGVSGSSTLTTNYMWRGVSQTMDLPAAQAGLTYTFPAGVYLSTWGSNVQFPGSNATVEIDAIGGLRGDIKEIVTYDVNYARYNYPGSTGTSYNEMNGLFTYKVFQLGLSYSGNVYATHQGGTYINGTITLGVPAEYILNIQDVTVAGEMGHYSLPRAAGNSYNDYSFTVNKKLNDTYSLMGQWTATNGRQHNPPYDGNQLLAAVNATF